MSAIDIFPWDDHFNTGLAKVDEQHRALVDLLNRLASQVAAGASSEALHEIFDALADYAIYHFETEEAIWHQYFADDPVEAAHQATHAAFGQEVTRLRAALDGTGSHQVAEEALGFLARWLASHILETDRAMAYAVQAIRQGMDRPAAMAWSRERMSGTSGGSWSATE